VTLTSKDPEKHVDLVVRSPDRGASVPLGTASDRVRDVGEVHPALAAHSRQGPRPLHRSYALGRGLVEDVRERRHATRLWHWL